MEIEGIKHKALRRFFETGNSRGLPADVLDRIRKMLAYIDSAKSVDELAIPPNYGLHRMTGDRDGTWSMTVTRNWRMTFRLNDEQAITDLDLEDYH